MSYAFRLTYTAALMENKGNTFEIDFKPVGFFLNDSGKVFSADQILFHEGILHNGSLSLKRDTTPDGKIMWLMETDLNKAHEQAHQLCIGIFLSKPDDYNHIEFDTTFKNFDILLELFEQDRNFPIYRYRLNKDFPYMQNIEVGSFKRHIADNAWHWHNMAKNLQLSHFAQRIGVNFT